MKVLSRQQSHMLTNLESQSIRHRRNEHVPEVERAGRTLIERVRAVWNTLPFKLTSSMIIGLTYYACKMINIFPKVNSIGGVAP